MYTHAVLYQQLEHSLITFTMIPYYHII